MKIDEIMTKKPIVVEAPGSRADILRVLAKGEVSGVPVVREKEVVGVVTRKDLFRKPEETQLALIMKRNPVTVKKKSRVETAAKLMLKNKIHRLPVVDRKKLVGIVTAFDILKVIGDMDTKVSIEQYVKKCVPIHQSTPVNVAFEILNITNEYALPVLGNDGKLVGIFTDRDLFKLSKTGIKKAVSDLGLGEDEDSWTWGGMRNIMKFYYDTLDIQLPSAPIEKVMVKNVFSATKNTSVSDVAVMMRKHDIGQMPVKNYSDHLVGMIHDLNLLKVLVK